MDADFAGYGNHGHPQSSYGLTLHFPPAPPPPPSDMELTNLNWVAGAPVPMQNPVSPTRKGAAALARSKLVVPQSREDCVDRAGVSSGGKQTFSGGPRGGGVGERGRGEASRGSREPSSTQRLCQRGKKGKRGGEGEGEARGKKPNCSYTSLIGLALMASEEGCLPVSEIYTYIEEEFPYFKSAPDGWKNSIRHNLSLNPAFRKVKDSLRWQGKKGYYWEVVPERWSSVEREVERYLRQEGKLRSPELNDGISSFPSCLQAAIPTMPHTPSPMPVYSFQFCTGTQPYYDIASSMLRYYPPPPTSLPPPPPPPSASTNDKLVLQQEIPLVRAATLLDTDISPSQFAGFSDPASSSAHSALHDLFGLHLSPQLTTLPTITYPHTLTHTDQHSSTTRHNLPQKRMAVPLPDCASGLSPNRHNVRLRKQALDQLTLSEENFSWTCDAFAKLRPNHAHFYEDPSILDHCMTLDECFVDGESGEDGEGDELGEGPLPPRTHIKSARGREGESVRCETGDMGEMVEGRRQAISTGSSPIAPSNGGGVCVCASEGVRRRGRRGGRRKTRRILTPYKPTTVSSRSQTEGETNTTNTSSSKVNPELFDMEEGGSKNEETRGEKRREEGESEFCSNSQQQTLNKAVFHGVACAVPYGVGEGSYSSPNNAHHHGTATFRPCHEVC